MFGVSEMLPLFLWALTIAVFVAAVVMAVILFIVRRRETPLSYTRKESIFDIHTERELFDTLQELYGDRYFVFPQVHYSHLLRPSKELSYRDRLVLRNKVDRKSADFVLCEKSDVSVRLVIELDGSSHDRPDRQERDTFINSIANTSNLNLLRMPTNRMDRASVLEQVDAKLAQIPAGSPK